MMRTILDRDIKPEDALDTHLRPQRLDEFVGQTKQKQGEFTQAASDLISARPLVAVGTALAVGYLLARVGR